MQVRGKIVAIMRGPPPPNAGTSYARQVLLARQADAAAVLLRMTAALCDCRCVWLLLLLLLPRVTALHVQVLHAQQAGAAGVVIVECDVRNPLRLPHVRGCAGPVRRVYTTAVSLQYTQQSTCVSQYTRQHRRWHGSRASATGLGARHTHDTQGHAGAAM